MTAPNKYAQLDAKLLELIRSGADTFNVLVVRRDINELAAPHETATTEAWRVVDRRLQALRKAGKISFSRKNDKWELKK